MGGDQEERQGPGPVPDSVMTLPSHYLKYQDNTYPFSGLLPSQGREGLSWAVFYFFI